MDCGRDFAEDLPIQFLEGGLRQLLPSEGTVIESVEIFGCADLVTDHVENIVRQRTWGHDDEAVWVKRLRVVFALGTGNRRWQWISGWFGGIRMKRKVVGEVEEVVD